MLLKSSVAFRGICFTWPNHPSLFKLTIIETSMTSKMGIQFIIVPRLHLLLTHDPKSSFQMYLQFFRWLL